MSQITCESVCAGMQTGHEVDVSWLHTPAGQPAAYGTPAPRAYDYLDLATPASMQASMRKLAHQNSVAAAIKLQSQKRAASQEPDAGKAGADDDDVIIMNYQSATERLGLDSSQKLAARPSPAARARVISRKRFTTEAQDAQKMAMQDRYDAEFPYVGRPDVIHVQPGKAPNTWQGIRDLEHNVPSLANFQRPPPAYAKVGQHSLLLRPYGVAPQLCFRTKTSGCPTVPYHATEATPHHRSAMYLMLSWVLSNVWSNFLFM